MPPKKAVVRNPAKQKATAYKLPPAFPEGELLTDITKKNSWILGPQIGQGGFGRIYTASKEGDKAKHNFVIKIEPQENGPLFCEVSFYKRVMSSKNVEQFVNAHKLKYLSVPEFNYFGMHTRDKVGYRFLVIPRLGTDLQSVFEKSSRQFSLPVVCVLALRMLDALQFIHEREYVHADIKAGNILLGWKNGALQSNRVYLVDFGLAFRYTVDGVHKPYKVNPTKAHDGTVEFTSIDAHQGIDPSRRGDLQILGYCLLQWLCGQLPWERNLVNKDYVRDEKIKYKKDLLSLMKTCFKGKKHPECVYKYLQKVMAYEYTDTPDYDGLRSIFRKEVTTSQEWTLDLAPTKTPTRARKRRSSVLNTSQESETSPEVKKGRKPKGKNTSQELDTSPEVKKGRKPKGKNTNQNATRPKPQNRGKATSLANLSGDLFSDISPSPARPKHIITKPTKAKFCYTSSSDDFSPVIKLSYKKNLELPDLSTHFGSPHGAHGTNSQHISQLSPVKSTKSSSAKSPSAKSPSAKSPAASSSRNLSRMIIPGMSKRSPLSAHTTDKTKSPMSKKTILSKVSPKRNSPLTKIPGASKLSPRSIIPGLSRSNKPPLTLHNGGIGHKVTPTATRQKKKRTNKLGVDVAIQTSPHVREKKTT